MDTRKFKPPYKHRRIASRNDYHSGKSLGANLAILPPEITSVTRILTQTAENCTAYSSVAARESMKDAKYDPEKQWLLELEFLGVTDAPNGVELKIPLAVAVKTGFVKEGETVPGDQASAYFFVKQTGLDWFDTIRTTIFQLYQKYGRVVPISIGVNWYHSWDRTENGIIPDSAAGLLGGHDIKIAGFQNFHLDNQDYILLQNSWGTGYGDNGLFRVSREVFNKYFNVYGAGYFVDDPDVQIQKYGFIEALLQNIVTLYQAVQGLIYKKKVIENTPVTPPDQVVPPPVPASKLTLFAKAIEAHENFDPRWNNPGALRFSAYTENLGATGHTPSNFCIFNDYKTGFAALNTLIKDAAHNRLIGYHDCTIKTFFETYSPASDGNNPLAYANFVSSKVGETIDTKLGNFI